MNRYLVIFDSEMTDEEYSNVEHKIAKYDGWASITKYAWFIVSNYNSATEIRDDFNTCFPDHPRVIYVIETSNKEWASCNIENNIIDWIKFYK